MFMNNYKKYLIVMIFIGISFYCSAQNSNITENRGDQKVNEFIPITTDAYTDSLFLQNLKKSEVEISRLNNPPIVGKAKVLDVQERIKNYEVARNKHSINSKEYRDVQAKIDRLKFEYDIKE